MKENFYLDDGTYSASQILIEVVRRRLAGEVCYKTYFLEIDICYVENKIKENPINPLYTLCLVDILTVQLNKTCSH